MPQHSRRLGILAAMLAVVLGLAAGACNGENEAQIGGRCFVTTDCAAGLVCVPQADGTTACSNNVADLQKPPSTNSSTGGTSGMPVGDGGGNTSSSGTVDPGDGGETSSSSSGGSSSSSSGSTSSSSSSSSSSGEPDAGEDGGP